MLDNRNIVKQNEHGYLYGLGTCPPQEESPFLKLPTGYYLTNQIGKPAGSLKKREDCRAKISHIISCSKATVSAKVLPIKVGGRIVNLEGCKAREQRLPGPPLQ